MKRFFSVLILMSMLFNFSLLAMLPEDGDDFDDTREKRIESVMRTSRNEVIRMLALNMQHLLQKLLDLYTDNPKEFDNVFYENLGGKRVDSLEIYRILLSIADQWGIASGFVRNGRAGAEEATFDSLWIGLIVSFGKYDDLPERIRLLPVIETLINSGSLLNFDEFFKQFVSTEWHARNIGLDLILGHNRGFIEELWELKRSLGEDSFPVCFLDRSEETFDALSIYYLLLDAAEQWRVAAEINFELDSSKDKAGDEMLDSVEPSFGVGDWFVPRPYCFSDRDDVLTEVDHLFPVAREEDSAGYSTELGLGDVFRLSESSRRRNAIVLGGGGWSGVSQSTFNLVDEELKKLYQSLSETIKGRIERDYQNNPEIDKAEFSTFESYIKHLCNLAKESETDFDLFLSLLYEE